MFISIILNNFAGIISYERNVQVATLRNNFESLSDNDNDGLIKTKYF